MGQLAAGGAQQARVLLCGREGAGQGHLAPALLAALEALPVHSIGLPSLLSDANSRSGEGPCHALVRPHASEIWSVHLPGSTSVIQ